MKIKILATGLELTAAIKKYVETKIGALTKVWPKNEAEENLDLELARTSKRHQHGEIFYAEATGKVFGKALRVETKNEDLYAAIDELKDILKKDLAMAKDKNLTRDVRLARKVKGK
jgi:ribosomal subunit interface protein